MRAASVHGAVTSHIEPLCLQGANEETSPETELVASSPTATKAAEGINPTDQFIPITSERLSLLFALIPSNFGLSSIRIDRKGQTEPFIFMIFFSVCLYEQ